MNRLNGIVFDGKGNDNLCELPTNMCFPSSSLGTVINAPGYSKVTMLKSWDQMPYKEKSLDEAVRFMYSNYATEIVITTNNLI